MGLDAFLHYCLEDHQFLADELFHFCLLKWMAERDLPMYKYDSPYVTTYLEQHACDQPKLLCLYYQHRGRWADACDAYLALAQGPVAGRTLPGGQPTAQLDVDEQILLLQSAALCAQMPGSNRRAEPIRQAMVKLTQMKNAPFSGPSLSSREGRPSSSS